MQKTRIYELAKKLGLTSKVIITELSKLGIEGKTHTSGIEPDIARTIESVLLKKYVEPPKETISKGSPITEDITQPQIEKLLSNMMKRQ